LIHSSDDTQDALDLDRIDLTRPNNRLDRDEIRRSSLKEDTLKIRDVTDLQICFDVPSGVFIEFGFVRVRISSNQVYERIVSVRYK
jgi:hypothetical protein